MSQALKFLQGAGAQDKLYVDDVFQSYVRTGTGASASITTGFQPDLVWTKARSAATSHYLTDSARGVTKSLNTNNANIGATDANGITAFSSTGYTVGSDTNYNNSTGPVTYVDWVFKKAPKFLDSGTFTGNGTTQNITHALGQVPGMVIVKGVTVSGSWAVWHRSLTAGTKLYMDSTGSESSTASANCWGNNTTYVDPTSTQFTVGSNVNFNQNGSTYVWYAFAHDTATDGIIQCGSFTSTGATRLDVDLGWQPQCLILKRSNSTGNWGMMDTMRGFPAVNVEASNDPTAKILYPNLSNAEGDYSVHLRTSGFSMPAGQFAGAGETYIYLAIRRPNKPPTTGTQVYNAIARTGTTSTVNITGVGFAPDFFGVDIRGGGGYAMAVFDRLRGATKWIGSSSTAAEGTVSDSLTAFGVDGVSLGADVANNITNGNVANNYINWFFRRAPGVLDEVCYTGTGVAKTEAHSLGVVPEMMIFKTRTGTARNWGVYHAALGNTQVLFLNTTDNAATYTTFLNSTTPTASVFTVGTEVFGNQNGSAIVAYLFATVAGISKVGSFTGTATTLQVNCGFTTGARFVLIKRSDAVADWYVWDTTRGIIAGNDPYLLLNSTAAEVTTTDYIDTYSPGFEISSTAPAAINANGGTFIYLAFA